MAPRIKIVARLTSALTGFLRPDAVDKAMIRVPDGASFDAAGTTRIREAAAAAAVGATPVVGSSLPAFGIRPDPGILPDASKEVGPDPLHFQFQFGANISYTPRSGYGTPFSILRSLASAPVIALCIQCRKDQMSSIDWDFALRDQREARKRKAGETDPRIAAARALFKKPDGRRTHKAWVQLLVDEALTIDACSIYRRPTVKGAAKLAATRGYKLAPDEVFGYDVIDGSTIKVLLDARGDVPAPPSIAYRQTIWGAPVAGGDLTMDQLLYRPKTERTWTPYGLSPIEAALLIITADLNRTMFNLAYFTEGNIPEALAGVPDNWTPKQIQQWQQYWDLILKGDPSNRSRLRFVVNSMAKSVHEFKKPDFTTAYDLWLLKLQCACFGVTPSEIGFTDDVNKATAKSQGDVNQRRGVKPMAQFIKAIQDEILADHGLEDVESMWSGGEGEDAVSQAKVDDIQVRNGSKSIDEIRAKNGDAEIGVGPCIVTAIGPVLWTSVNDPKPDVPDASANNITDLRVLNRDGSPASPKRKTENSDQVADKSGDTDVKAAAVRDELRKYRAVAVKAVKSGRQVPAFESSILSPVVLQRVRLSLAGASSAEDVTKVFAMVEKAQRLSSAQKKQQARMRSKLSGILADEAKAFAAHIAAGVEAHA